MSHGKEIGDGPWQSVLEVCGGAGTVHGPGAFGVSRVLASGT